MTLDRHTNLFIRVRQLQMTNERLGLPDHVVLYLLYEQNLEVDWDEVDREKYWCDPRRNFLYPDSDSDSSSDSSSDLDSDPE